MFNYIKQHKVLSLVLFFNLVAILVVIVIIVIHNLKTATISIRVAPVAATVELNGAKYENLESHNVAPGDYHVKISMEGMQTKELDFSIGEDGFVRVWDYLLNSNGSFDYYLNHREDELLLKDIISKDDIAAQSFIVEYERMFSISNVLPIMFDSYTDDFAYYTRYEIEFDDSRDDCPKIFCLVIEDNTGGNEQKAMDKIKELGYNPDDYEIKYEFVPLYNSEINNE